MTKFGDKTVLHVHVQVTSSFSQPLYYESVVGHKNARNESMSVDTDQIYL